jgi:hypothetical protein
MNFRHNIASQRSLTDVAYPLSDPVTARITLLDGSMTGRREVGSYGSILQLIACPFADLEKLKANIIGGYVVYVIDTPQMIYTGHGRVSTRNIGDRIDEADRQASQVYAIFSGDLRFDKPTASYVEARVIDIAADLAIPQANSIRPFGLDGLNLSADLEQLVADTLFLLAVAGFRRFEDAWQTEPGSPVRVAATGDLDDVLIIEPDAAKTMSIGAILQRLVCRDLHAVGCVIGDRFLILPDAEYAFETKSGLSPHNWDRREVIERMNILKTLPDFTDRARLSVGLSCKSAAIAAKIVTGEHIGTSAWQTITSADDGITP